MPLIAATANDFDFFYRLYMHPKNNIWLLYAAMPPDEFRPIYADLLAKGVLWQYKTADGIPAGMCKLIPYTYRTAHVVYLGGVAIDPDLSGRGYGTAMLQEIIGYARSKGFRRIELSVTVGNDAAKNLYEKVGFRQEGILREFAFLETENRYANEILMSILI
ncbi:GNAT family N-acetyltransferase [Rhodoflexus caldus]|uniref:GNAT family N-acetyltransferase n=1 Tax=Rhodoflexus caldus TaxID=2891236 RepID=UPI00202A4C36|nr:GNAT family N-acetyltransferase [Rhodoflexus caldus]